MCRLWTEKMLFHSVFLHFYLIVLENLKVFTTSNGMNNDHIPLVYDHYSSLVFFFYFIYCFFRKYFYFLISCHTFISPLYITYYDFTWSCSTMTCSCFFSSWSYGPDPFAAAAVRIRRRSSLNCSNGLCTRDVISGLLLGIGGLVQKRENAPLVSFDFFT